MARTKHTEQKSESQSLPKATKAFRCPDCAKEFLQLSNMNRHRGIIHGKGTDKGPLDEQTKAKYAQYNAKPAKGQPPKAPTVVVTGSPSTSTSPLRKCSKSPTPTKGLSPARKVTKEDVFGDIISSSADSDVFVE